MEELFTDGVSDFPAGGGPVQDGGEAPGSITQEPGTVPVDPAGGGAAPVTGPGFPADGEPAQEMGQDPGTVTEGGADPGMDAVPGADAAPEAGGEEAAGNVPDGAVTDPVQEGRYEELLTQIHEEISRQNEFLAASQESLDEMTARLDGIYNSLPVCIFLLGMIAGILLMRIIAAYIKV